VKARRSEATGLYARVEIEQSNVPRSSADGGAQPTRGERGARRWFNWLELHVRAASNVFAREGCDARIMRRV